MHKYISVARRIGSADGEVVNRSLIVEIKYQMDYSTYNDASYL